VTDGRWTVRQFSSYHLSVPEVLLDLTLEDRVLDAAKACCERWGMAKVTVDDIAAEARCSRATVYRLFPGGKDNLYEALRQRSTREFFSELDAHLAEATSYEELLVRGLVAATRALRDDEHLQLMLASSPGEVMTELTVAGLPRIFDAATLFLTPRFAPHIGTEASGRLAEWLARVVISYFLSPSRHVDLGDPGSARQFVDQFVLPAFPALSREA
jgi:AcrR family transcriptional regulator